MVAKYRENYFCIDLSCNPVQIWSYTPVSGFEEKKTRRGTIYYEKSIGLSELDEVFDVGFSAFWNGAWCGVHYSAKTDEVGLYSNDLNFAQKYGMRELERFAYEIVVPASSVEQYRFTRTDAFTKTKHEEIITAEQLRILWKQFYTDLMPPRN